MTTEPFDYRDGDTQCRGALALPGGSDKRPGIAIFADLGGIGEHTERYTNDLASLGYLALAADVYGDGKSPKDFAEGMPWVQSWKADPAALAKRAAAALEAVRTDHFSHLNVSGLDARELEALGNASVADRGRR